MTSTDFHKGFETSNQERGKTTAEERDLSQDGWIAKGSPLHASLAV